MKIMVLQVYVKYNVRKLCFYISIINIKYLLPRLFSLYELITLVTFIDLCSDFTLLRAKLF
jgi:hypothetical protein